MRLVSAQTGEGYGVHVHYVDCTFGSQCRKR
jgi:hypothetical protein